MGYTTDFNGSFNLNKPLSAVHAEYLIQFSSTRRMKRDANKAANLPDPVREAVNLPIGKDGEYFVGASGSFGQDKDDSVIDYNTSPSEQPGLWCQWVPNEDGTGIEWDGGEKFYSYVEWLDYLIYNFLAPWGYILNGEVEWQGEDRDDRGLIVVKNNEVTTKIGRIVYE
jgi:hypothetical protein